MIVDLFFLVVKDIDIAVCDGGDGIGRSVGADFSRTAVQTDHDGMSHIGPECGIFHRDVAASADKSLACGIDGGAVVAVAAEHIVVMHVIA